MINRSGYKVSEVRWLSTCREGFIYDLVLCMQLPVHVMK